MVNSERQWIPVPLSLLTSLLGTPAHVSEMKVVNAPTVMEHTWECGCAAAHSENDHGIARWRACSQHVDIFFTHRNRKALARARGPRRNNLRRMPRAITPLLLVLVTLGTVEISALLGRIRRAESEALIDGLTGLYNRRGWARRSFEETKRPSLQAATITVFVMDVDDLKLINDRDGHTAGDAALIKVAAVIRAATREHDVAARLGGDEFALLAIDAGTGGASGIAERLVDGFNREGLSVSIGRAEVAAEGFAAAMDTADAQMYAEKQRRKSDRVALSVAPARRK